MMPTIRTQCFAGLLEVVLLLTTTSVLHAQRSYPPELPGSREEVYKTVGDVKLKMWIYTPAGHDFSKARRPAIVFFFGGGWKAGTPSQFETQCQYLASRGMVAATADYRVATRHGVMADACVEDAKSAVRWLRASAGKLGIDPDRICAAGGSAGGHTACCTALIEGFDSPSEDKSVSSVPNALALFNPAVMIAPLDGFDESGLAEEKFADIAGRTGVPPSRISPIHHVRAGLPPTIIFHGKADPTVPYATVQEFSRRMSAAGNHCELKGFEKAAHGFFNAPRGKDPERRDLSDQWHRRTLLQLDQFLRQQGWVDDKPSVRVVDQDFVSLRGHLQNSLRRFESERQGHVAFIGGSITEMNGYRPRVEAWLKERFPMTDFVFTNAGISSTCSHTGAFRLQRDVLSKGPVDLLFVEFAVNDDQDAGHSADGCLRGMEGILRQLRRHNPSADVVMTHFVNPGMLDTLNAERKILSASQHERIARHYNVSSVYLSRIVNSKINNGAMTWKEFGGTHPGPSGNQLAADMATSILDTAWKGLQAETLTVTPHPVPETPLSDSCFDFGRLLTADNVTVGRGWQYSEPSWTDISGAKRQRFLGRQMLHSYTPGATLRVRFRGTAAGVYVLAGPDAGQLEYRIDDGEWKTVELFHRFSRRLHYPRTVMFASDLPDADHSAEIRVGSQHHADSKGTAVRILNPVINGTAVIAAN